MEVVTEDGNKEYDNLHNTVHLLNSGVIRDELGSRQTDSI